MNEPKNPDEEIDEIMSKIGIGIANEMLGKPADADDVDDIIIERLSKANQEQREDIADNMLDTLALAEVLRSALSDDGSLDKDEVEEVQDYLSEIEDNTKEVIKSLVK